jgi:hypothetical protein
MNRMCAAEGQWSVLLNALAQHLITRLLHYGALDDNSR